MDKDEMLDWTNLVILIVLASVIIGVTLLRFIG